MEGKELGSYIVYKTKEYNIKVIAFPPWAKFKNVDIKKEISINVSLGIIDLNIKVRKTLNGGSGIITKGGTKQSLMGQPCHEVCSTFAPL